VTIEGVKVQAEAYPLQAGDAGYDPTRDPKVISLLKSLKPIHLRTTDEGELWLIPSKNAEQLIKRDVEESAIRGVLKCGEFLLKVIGPHIVERVEQLQQIRQLEKRLETIERRTVGKQSIEGQDEFQKSETLWPSLVG
jgi:hypothetical protein